MNVFELFAKISVDSSEYERGLDGASKESSSFGQKLKSGLATAAKITTAAIGATTTAVTAFAKKSIDAGAQFDSAMSQVGSISGATGEEFDKLRDKAMEMGAKTKFSATESAEAFTYMAMAGWKTEDMLNGIDGIMNLAAASGEDLATTSDIVTDALTAFGLSAADSGHFADVLASASSNANTNVGMLGESFKYAAPLAGAMNYSVEDMAVALGLMANSGIKASQAGTSFRAAMSQMLKPSDPTLMAMEKLGLAVDGTVVALENADGTAKSLGETMDILRAAFSGLSETEQSYYAAQIFGTEAMSGMLAIINASESDYEKLTKAINNADGAAMHMAETMQDNLTGDITIFKSALEGAQIVLSDQLTPALREFVQFGTNGVSSLTNAFQNGGLGEMIEVFGEILGEAVSKILEGLPKIVEAGKKLLEALLQGLVDNLPTILPSVVEVIEQIASFIIDNLPMLIDAALQIVVTLAQGIAESLPQMVPQIVEVILNIVNTLLDNVDLLVDTAIQLMMGLTDGLVAAIPILTEKAPEIIIKLVSALVENYPKLIEASFQMMGELVKGIIDNLPRIYEAGQRINDKLAEVLKNLAIKAKQWGMDMLKGFVDGIFSMLGNVGNAAKSVANTISSFLHFSVPEKGPLADFDKSPKDMMQLFADGIKKNAGIMRNALDSALEGMGVIDGNIRLSSDLAYSGNGTNAGIAGGYQGSGFGNVTYNITVQTTGGSDKSEARKLAERLYDEMERIRVRRNRATGGVNI